MLCYEDAKTLVLGANRVYNVCSNCYQLLLSMFKSVELMWLVCMNKVKMFGVRVWDMGGRLQVATMARHCKDPATYMLQSEQTIAPSQKESAKFESNKLVKKNSRILTRNGLTIVHWRHLIFFFLNVLDNGHGVDPQCPLSNAHFMGKRSSTSLKNLAHKSANKICKHENK